MTKNTKITDPTVAMNKARAAKATAPKTITVDKPLAEMNKAELFTVLERVGLSAPKRTTIESLIGQIGIAEIKVIEPGAEPTVEAPAEPVASEDRVERLQLAKAEKVALDEWFAGGQKGPKPSTPNYDTLSTTAKPGAKGKGKTSAKVEVPAPKLERGQKLVELRNARHGETIVPFLPVASGVCVVVDRWLVLDDKASAESLLDAIESATPAGEFERRLLMLASLWIRIQFPKIADTRTSAAPTALRKLIEAGKDFEVRARQDAQPEFVIDGTAHTARGVIALLDA